MEFNHAGIENLKSRIKDKDALLYIEQIEQQNDRLHSHHSDCKQEIGRLAELAQRWRIQAAVAEGLAQYLNEIYLPGSSFAHREDLHKEIKMQTERLVAQHKQGIEFWKDPIVAKIFPDRDTEPVAA